MDFTELADPATLTKLLTSVFGVKLATWITALMLWQSAARILFVPFRKKIQDLADAVLAFSRRTGNTEIHQRLEKVGASTTVKVMCFLLNYGLSIKLGPERGTTITTTTETATLITKTEVPAPVAQKPTVIEKTAATATATTTVETPVDPAKPE